MPDYRKVAELSKCEQERIVLIDVNGDEVALFYVDGTVYAIENRCSHIGAPLSDGVVYDCEVECPLHGARFNLATGENLCPPADTPVRTYPIKIEDGFIFLAV